jgi:hypothetical protein
VALGLTGSFALATGPANAAPTPVTGSLNGVSCAEPTTCEAVGSYVSGGATLTLAEAWNGTAWSVQTTPNPAGGSSDVLAGVACRSATSCLAVGSYFAGSGLVPLAEVWNGSTWTMQTVPLPAGGRGGGLNGVACVAATCTVVGDYADPSNTNVALAESWNGSDFTAQTVPAPDGASINTLTAVSCIGSPHAKCEAVGWYFVGGLHVATTMAEGWNGTAWTVQGPPEPPDANGGSYPSGVSCASARSCTSVGTAFNDSDALAPAWAQHWDGTAWSNQALKGPKRAIASEATGVSCSASPSVACEATGYFSNGSNFVSFASGRSGAKKWKAQTTPQPKGSTAGALNGVSCTAPSACIAVGDVSNHAGSQLTLADAWDGSQWTMQTTPTP